MKSSRFKKMIGISLGEKSLLAAEVSAGEVPQVTQMAEVAYPAGIGLDQPAELGAALRTALAAHGFSARAAVVGIEAKWLVVRPKEMPVADDATLKDLLRLATETEFPADLKEMVYEYTQGAKSDKGQTVLLMATARRNVELASAMCVAAKLQPVAVTAAAVALGAATRQESLVLTTAAGGAELSARGGTVRYLRGPVTGLPFVGELRRIVLSLPAGTGREMVLWDSEGVDPKFLGNELGIPVRGGQLSALGVQTSVNGDGARFGGAVALALRGLDAEIDCDFLHSRLAAPTAKRLPSWVIPSAAIAVVLILLSALAYMHVQTLESNLADTQAKVAADKSAVDAANQFIDNTEFASNWYKADKRYTACLNDLTEIVPPDGNIFATTLTLREVNSPMSPESTETGSGGSPEGRTLAGTLSGHATGADNVNYLLRVFGANPRFTEVKPQSIRRNQDPQGADFTFQITFLYTPAPAWHGGQPAEK